MTRRAQQPVDTGRDRRHVARTILRLELLESRTLLSAAPSGLQGLTPGSYDPTQILVQFRPAVLTAGAPALNVPGAVLGQQLDASTGLYDVQLNGLSVPDALARFLADPRVQSVEPDYYVTVAGTPNDPQFGGQWGLSNTGQAGGVAGVDVHAAQAWTVTTGSPGVVVALIDTGVDINHPELYQNIWINQAEIPDQWFTKASAASKTFDKVVLKSQIKTAAPGVITFADLNNPVNAGLVWDVNGDGRIDAADLLHPLAQGGWQSGSTKDGDTKHPDDFFGWNFVANNNNPLDDNGHGTNVAGIIGAKGNNGVGVAGLDWQVQLQDLKVFDSRGFSSISEIVAAIDYSIQHGAKISNNSWSVGSDEPDLFAAIGRARSAGQIFVAAAGNGGSSTADTPAAYRTLEDNIVSVTAVDRTGALLGSANYGATTVTLAAPGVNILSTAPGGGYSTYTGTSQAVPFVTGTLALVWGQHPDWTYKQVIAQVTSTTTTLSSLRGKTVTGGLVNAGAALGVTSSNGGGGHNPPPGPSVWSAAFSGPDAHSLNHIIVTFNQAIDLATFNSAQVTVKNPAGQAIVLTALKLTSGSSGNQFEIDFAAQTAGGTYTLYLGAGIRNTAGIALAPFSTAYHLVAAPYTFANTQATAIPDLGTIASSVTVSQDVTIASLQVALNITHTYDGDLFIYLQAPDGTTTLLVNRRGGSGDDFQNTVLSDSAASSIRSATAPFAGAFQPETPLSVFLGKNARGVWKLWVSDKSAGDVGVLKNWSLIIVPGANGPAPAGEAAIVRGEKESAPLISPLAWVDADQTLAPLEMNPVDWRQVLANDAPPSPPEAGPTPNQSSRDRTAVVDALFVSGTAPGMRAVTWPPLQTGGGSISDDSDLLAGLS
jgi:serine protease